MKQCVSIKSFSNGLKVYIDEDASFEEVLDQVKVKFAEFEKFFKNTKIALSFEGKELTEQQERQIVNEISNACALEIACIVGCDERTERTFVKALNELEYEKEENLGQFYKGSLKNGQGLETEQSIIILGDVYPDSTIISKKNIVILGGLYGHAIAGVGGDNCFVVALDMSPQSIKIGSKKATLEKGSKWLIKPKQVPKIAHLMDDQVLVTELKFTEELLNGFM